MSSEDTTHFQLNVNGISLELSGEREFVQMMYRKIMGDLEIARSRMLSTQQRVSEPEDRSVAAVKRRLKAKQSAPAVPQDHVIWLHRCNEMVHKIYMASTDHLENAPMFAQLRPEAIRTLYIQDPLLSRALPTFERGQTLWAELTEAGRRKIAEATHAYNAATEDA